MEYKWTVLSNTTLGVLMASLDTNIVLIALPTIGHSLPGMNAFNVLWVILGYQIVIASVLVNFGRLSDLFGRVKLYNIGFAVFTIGSGLCSISQTADQLIGFRIIQATGAAFLFSNSAAIITDAFPPNERGKALGINQVSIVVGSVAGLVIGGILTTTIGWQSIFLVNLPIGIFATTWAHFRLKELSKPSLEHRIDVNGNVFFALGLIILLLGITLNAVTGLSDELTAIMIVFSLLSFWMFVRAEKKAPNPMFDLTLFRNRIFDAGNETIFLNALSRGSFVLVMVFYLQGPLMQLSPLDAGLFLIPMSVSLSIAGPISGSLSDRYGFRSFVILGLALSAAGFLIMAGIGKTITSLQVLFPLMLIGSGMGFFASPNRSSIMNSVPAHQRGVASGISTTFVNIGNTLSIGLAFLFMGATTPRTTLDLIFSGTSSGIGDFSYSDFLTSVHLVFYMSALMLIISILIYIWAYRKGGNSGSDVASSALGNSGFSEKS